MTYGGAVSLTGVARGVDGRVARVEDGGAAGLGPGRRRSTLGPDGSFSTIVRPQATTAVPPRVGRRARGPREDRRRPARRRDRRPGLRQRIDPAGARVGRRCSSSSNPGQPWTTVSSTVTDAAGAWSFSGALPPGTYRIRCAPGQGLARRRLRDAARASETPGRGRDRHRSRSCVPRGGGGVRQHRAARGPAVVPRRRTAPGRSGRRSRSSAPVNVAVIDSGIDGTPSRVRGPDRRRRGPSSAARRTRDDQGHGTFVAGEIAANPFNGLGIAGLAFNARLLIAKVVEPDGSVSLKAEVAAIRWAVDNGARVINLSLGGVRDPLDPTLDTYSPLEQAAVEYAYSKGAVVVAAVGNGPQSPATPWQFADYPAALPHVIGVGAVRQDGSVPDYSNRDAVYVDLAAPGDGDLLDHPAQPGRGPDRLRRRAVLRLRPVRVPRRDRHVVRGAAGLRRGGAAARRGPDAPPGPGRVAARAQRRRRERRRPAARSARPAATRSPGWGTLDVAGALTGSDAGRRCRPPTTTSRTTTRAPGRTRCRRCRARSRRRSTTGTTTIDVYRVYLQKGQRLFARARRRDAPATSGSSSGRPARSRSTGSTRQQLARRPVAARRSAGAARLPAPRRPARTTSRSSSSPDARPARLPARGRAQPRR